MGDRNEISISVLLVTITTRESLFVRLGLLVEDQQRDRNFAAGIAGMSLLQIYETGIRNRKI